ncbi:AP-5 complex subunit beta-1 [Denticeps clupeoides]|uniref:AP-5 complex subunit beta-1 n=1 Tax=Denticeps clupeoides TaxID=299321 RepID=A0AAY4BT96_9TELE|nr:AP-5 complex subunit beta-1 [Denticeps clupeoides]
MAAPDSWAQKVSAFLLSPSEFLSSASSDCFLPDLLRELRDDRASDSTKVLLLRPLLEQPGLLCGSSSAAEEAALELMSVLAQTPRRAISLRSHLMLAISTLLICSAAVEGQAKVAEDFLDQLFRDIQDRNDHGGSWSQHAVQATACECLREMELSHPGLLSQRLETLHQLKQQETTLLHQAYCVLYTLALKNAVFLLTQKEQAADGDLKVVLSGSEGFGWRPTSATSSLLTSGPMGPMPQLGSGVECKELRSTVSLLLEESYLLTPVSQASLLKELMEIICMAPALSPAILKSQLLRLFGTAEVQLLHATLLMKGAFTDSLFSGEDELFFLKRLVVMAQHPLLAASDKLFYVQCVRHFPENRPLSSQEEEGLPVLVMPRLVVSLLPSIFNDSGTMLGRLGLLCLVHLEADEGEESRGLAYLFQHVTALLRIISRHQRREMVVTAFRAVFIFLTYFHHVERFAEDLVQQLSELYSRHCYLAPHLMNLADQIQRCLEDSAWPVQLLRTLQRSIVEMPVSTLNLENLSWHLRVLGRVAKERQISQRSTLCFLLNVFIHSNLCEQGSWQVGSAVLVVCRNLLQHPCLNQVSIQLADLLQHLSSRYEDTDVQDHARLYYTLLTNLSEEKLSGVLEQAADSGQAKVRSLSSIMAENDGLSSCLVVHSPTHPVLQLTKVSTPSSEKTSVQFSSEVALRYQLTHAGPPDSAFDRLFSICISLELDDCNYEDVSDIHVPCLFRDRKPPEVTITLRPRRPYPTRLRVHALFTTEDGRSWRSRLPDVNVSFPELFLPVSPCSSDTTKEELFQHLWESVCSDPSGGSTTSLFCYRAGDGSTVQENFRRYLTSEEPSPVAYQVFFFLPPRFHVLLKVGVTEDAAHVQIATDNWELLPHVNSYLKSATQL